ncbi:MAG TPA: transglycosylase domain-containing protein [Pyrinomonadaceae bacterium]|nr:transglycosylase domain-containing protein [Pyrinomonadaceae bacterium]
MRLGVWIVNAIVFFTIAISTAALHVYAEKTVSERVNSLQEYRDLVDLMVCDQPTVIQAGTAANVVEHILKASDFGECSVEDKPVLTGIGPRIFCRRENILAVHAFEPFKSFVLEVSARNQRIVRITDEQGREIDRVELPSPVVSAVNLDENGKVIERVRYELILGKDVNKDATTIKFLIEIEDRRFFEHRGNDWWGIARAGFRFIFGRSDEVTQGGSTITEQVAKLVFLSDENKLIRRIKALFLAEALERRLTKQQILELWLNRTVMGIERPTESPASQEFRQRRESVYGFATAARVLFNKSLFQCTPTELATLASLPRYPQIFPTLKKNGQLDVSGNENHRRLDQRRKLALKTFGEAQQALGHQELGQKFLDSRNTPVRFSFNEDDQVGDEALITFVERDLKEQIDRRALPPHTARVKSDGKSTIVFTTIDQGYQTSVSQQIEKELPAIKVKLAQLAGITSNPGSKKKPFSFEVQLDVVALGSEDGSLKGLSSAKTQNNGVIPNRSNVNPPSFICSVAKPLHTAYGFSEGVITATTLIRASDCQAPNGFRFDAGQDSRLLPFANHLTVSRNGPFICLGNRLGIQKVLLKWRELFPNCNLPGPGFVPDPYQIMRGLNRPEADLPPTAVAEAYTALANRGERRDLRVIDRMYSDNKQTFIEPSPGRQVFTEPAAVLTASLLRAGTKGLTQWQPTPGFDLAAKTGSSSNTYWTVFFSPRIVVVVRYLIVPGEKLVDEAAALRFSKEVERRFEKVFAANVVKPFADTVLALIKVKRRDWLRGTFAHNGLIRLLIDPERDCATQDGSGIRVDYIRGTEPTPCPASTLEVRDSVSPE